MTNSYDRAMSRRRNVLVPVAVAVALAACSGSDESTPTTPSTSPNVVTTVVSTTTDAPTTTALPTTTLDPTATLAAEVEADYRETIRRTDEAFMDPTNDDKVAAALDGYVGANREFLERRFIEFREKNWAARPNPNFPSWVDVEVPAELIPPSVDLAQVQICESDSLIVVEVGAGPNGGDAVVDNSVSAYRSTFFLRLVDGRWRSEGSKKLATWEGVATCAAE